MFLTVALSDVVTFHVGRLEPIRHFVLGMKPVSDGTRPGQRDSR